MAKKTPKTPKRIIRKNNEKLVEAITGATLLINIPLELRIEQASKPLYLTRYE